MRARKQRDYVISESAAEKLNLMLDGSEKRIHITNHELSMSDFMDIENHEEGFNFYVGKPTGLWFGHGNSWIDWCASNMGGWVDENVYEIEVDESDILRITNAAEFDAFEKEYAIEQNYGMPFSPMLISKMDYNKVASRYSGIEINPYNNRKRLSSMWYYTWDCSSGCVWKKKALKSIKLIAKYNRDKEEYDFFS